jgi:hypothetical protein
MMLGEFGSRENQERLRGEAVRERRERERELRCRGRAMEVD